MELFACGTRMGG